MIFPLVDYALRQGQRIALATPRVDVCNELFPRFQAAFPDIDILLLHGKVDHPYRLSPLTIASTHQLLRFYQAFDLLIVDEVDAFP
ncbi:DNA/RNA helicase, partial [Streptococcus anginosus]|nr:DNA/RNA helicase [Streptococcus anginosus]